MAKDVFKIVGLETLNKELQKLPDKVAVKAGRAGTMKGAAYMRTQLRRSMPKPVRGWFGIKAIVAKRLKRPTPGGGVGAAVHAPNIFNIFERGRSEYQRPKKSGNMVAGSPDMKRWQFWNSTTDAHKEEAMQKVVDHTKAAIIKESIAIYKKTLRGK